MVELAGAVRGYEYNYGSTTIGSTNYGVTDNGPVSGVRASSSPRPSPGTDAIAMSSPTNEMISTGDDGCGDGHENGAHDISNSSGVQVKDVDETVIAVDRVDDTGGARDMDVTRSRIRVSQEHLEESIGLNRSLRALFDVLRTHSSRDSLHSRDASRGSPRNDPLSSSSQSDRHEVTNESTNKVTNEILSVDVTTDVAFNEDIHPSIFGVTDVVVTKEDTNEPMVEGTNEDNHPTNEPTNELANEPTYEDIPVDINDNPDGYGYGGNGSGGSGDEDVDGSGGGDERSSLVPYSTNLLTHLLQDCLVDTARTIVIVCVR